MFIRKGSNFYNDNQWHHYAIIFSPNKNNIYIDSVPQSIEFKYGSVSTETNIIPSTLKIGTRHREGLIDYQYDKSIGDDIRIYLSPISEEEILDIYQQKTRVSIDKNGNFWAREFLDQDSSTLLSIGKTQIIKSGNEGNNTVSIRSDGIHAKKIIRY